MNLTKNNCPTIAVLYLFISIALTLLMSGAPFSISAQAYEGFGAVTKGAEDAPGGYETYHVTKLDDDGSPGTLRDAVSQGSRLIVFDVGGTITLEGDLNIRYSYITIDGASAPEPGITILQPGTIGTTIEARPSTGPVSDVIIHHLRMDGQAIIHENVGDIWGIDGESAPVSNVIIDHVTGIAATDGVFDVYGEVRNVTISWNLITDTVTALHLSKSSQIRERISFHHNVFARNNERQIKMRHHNDLIDFVNNVIYGWSSVDGWGSGLHIGPNIGMPDADYPTLNVENNVYHYVSGYGDEDEAIIRDNPTGKIYFNGNIFPAGETDNYDTSTRHIIPAYAEVTTYDASTLGDTVVPFVGTHYPTQEEQDLLDEISIAIGGQGPVDPPSWQPPIGIPRPEFGIKETYRMYDEESNRNPALTYTQNAEGGFYTHYIDNTHPDATDTDNPYGTASIPRNTIPLNLVAGSVVEVHGGPYTYINSQGSFLGIIGIGTVTQPIIVRGADIDNRPIFNSGVQVDGEYIILENIDSDGSTGPRNGGVLVLGPAHHIAVRHSEIQNRVGGPNTALFAGTFSSEWTHDIVFYDNKVHDVGDWQTTIDEDHIAIAPGGCSYNVWIVDNEIWHASADGTGVSSGNVAPSNLTHHIYVGRNVYYQNKQGGVWVKNAQDVIISQNEVYDITPSPSSSGQCMGYQYDPQRVWYLFNHLHNATVGIISGSSNIGTREDIYLIGNVIHDVETGININSHGVEDDSEMIIGNTIYNVSSGIRNSYYNAHLDMSNNIIANVSEYHLLIPGEYGTPAYSDISYSLFDSPVSINWNDNIYNSVASFQSAEGKGSGCIEADPQFIDAANGDFHLQPTSPVIDNGTLSNVYQTFFNLYGIDIRKDIEGNSRPQGSGWDIGAYEYVAFSPSPNQPPIADAGLDQTITDKDKDGSEEVTLDGSASRDPDGTIVSFIWSEDDSQIATGINPTVTLSTGTHSITLTVTDDGGLTDTDTVTIKVLEGDKGFGELPAGCYNNVFNPAKGERALIVVELPKQAHVRLNLYNTRGNRIRELADEQKEPGTHKYYWDGKSGNGDVVGSGLYFVHIQAGDYKKTKKIVVVK